jgi:hypothetical protein
LKTCCDVAEANAKHVVSACNVAIDESARHGRLAHRQFVLLEVGTSAMARRGRKGRNLHGTV